MTSSHQGRCPQQLRPSISTRTWRDVVVAASTDMGAVLRLLSIAFLLFFGMLGCKNIQPSDLTGTWVMRDASRQVLPAELQKASAKIVLDANGTFVASDMPGLFYF